MKPDSAILTIAIPTYNRAAKLQAQLERLMPQMRPEVRVCVFDNASTDGTRAVAEPYQSKGVIYSCAPFNGGGGRNFLRCFEECQTEWVWILSDDDPISASAVPDLLRIIAGIHADFIHTSSPQCRHGSDAFVDNIPDLLHHSTPMSLLWITSGVYRISAFRPLLWLFSESISTCGPQMILVLALLERRKGTVLVTTLTLIDQSPDQHPRWSTLDFIVRFGQTPEYIINPRSQALVAQSCYSEAYYPALMVGLRELSSSVDIRRWQRARKLARQNFSAYGTLPPILDVILKNKWFLSGNRKSSLLALQQALTLVILSCCPTRLFPVVLKILPRPIWGLELPHQKNRKPLELDTTANVNGINNYAGEP